MKAQLGPTKAQLARAAGIINVRLTVEERDRIDAAKARIGRFLRFCLWVDAAEAGPASEIYDFPDSVGDLLELMLEDVDVINATFELADQRATEEDDERAYPCRRRQNLSDATGVRMVRGGDGARHVAGDDGHVSALLRAARDGREMARRKAGVMAFDPTALRHSLYSAPCAVCQTAVGATGTFRIREDDSSSVSWFGPFCPTTHRPAPAETETIISIAERLDRVIDFLASPEGITTEKEVILPAVQRALDDYHRRPKKKQGGA